MGPVHASALGCQQHLGIRNKEIFRGRREPLIRYRDFEFLKFAGRQQDLKCDCLEPLICNDHHQPPQR